MAQKMKSRQKASQEYWEEREKEALKQTRLTEEQFAAEIEKIYGDMRREVNSRISNWYVRYADESGIDIAEAKKRVSKLDMEEYAELARKYVELARKEETRALAFTDEANEQMKLYNLTMKVNRLENLKAQIGLELCGGFSQLEKKYGTFLNEQMMEEYDRQSGILGMTTKRPEAIRRQAEAVVNGSFHNATFSERLWNQQDALKGELDRLLSRALIQGLNPRAVAPELRKKFGASEMAADLLMITELCRVQTEAQKMAFKEYGYEEYTFICNGGACEACEALSGKHFKVSEMLAGQNAPPMHPRCRCSTAAYMNQTSFGEWLEAKSGEPRTDIAIDNPDNRSPGSQVLTEEQKLRRKMANNTKRDKEQFRRYRKVLGDMIPDSLESFQKMKYTNTGKWNAMKHNYRIVNSYEINAGSMTPEKILQLDDIAFSGKKGLFTGKAKKNANIAVMEIDGTVYYANSKATRPSDPAYQNFKGDKSLLILMKADGNRRFDTLEIGTHDRKVDSEAKLFEFAADIVKDGKSHYLNIISERCMCDSCIGVMKQFKKAFPNARVNAVSGKRDRAEQNHNNPWGHRN